MSHTSMTMSLNSWRNSSVIHDECTSATCFEDTSDMRMEICLCVPQPIIMYVRHAQHNKSVQKSSTQHSDPCILINWHDDVHVPVSWQQHGHADKSSWSPKIIIVLVFVSMHMLQCQYYRVRVKLYQTILNISPSERKLIAYVRICIKRPSFAQLTITHNI